MVFGFFLIIGCFILADSELIHAATKIDKPVIKIEGTGNDKEIQITIAKCKDVDGFLIYMKSDTDSKYKKIKKLKKDGNITRFTYDRAGRVVEKINSLNEKEKYADIMTGAAIETIGNTTKSDDRTKTTTTTAYDPRNDIIVTLYGVAPIRDVLSDIHSEIESSVDAVAENNTPSQEK